MPTAIVSPGTSTAMTTTYDPKHPAYLDEADVRGELTRVFDLCRDCRRCATLCASFPILFDLIDRFDDRDSGRLTPAEQDQVVDACSRCTLCSLGCPYVPERHEWRLDFPRLMLRAEAMRHANGQHPIRRRIADRMMGRPDLVGAVAIAFPPAGKTARAPAGSFVRRLLGATVGVSPERLLPPSAKQRFSTWARRRSAAADAGRRGTVTVYPTCLVEYHDVQVGKDLVRVYERNGIGCSIARAGCCGAPWLQAGDIGRFAAAADRNVARLAEEVRSGRDVVVAEPTCAYVLRHDYPDHVAAERLADAELVAEHTRDASEYLVRLHRDDRGGLDTRFTGEVPATITHHAACHLRAQRLGIPSRDLMELTGAIVTVVEQCSGTGGTWGLRAGNEPLSVPMAERLGDRIAELAGDVVTGDCALANTAIAERSGTVPTHPLSLLARAYGIPVDD